MGRTRHHFGGLGQRGPVRADERVLGDGLQGGSRTDAQPPSARVEMAPRPSTPVIHQGSGLAQSAAEVGQQVGAGRQGNGALGGEGR